MKVCDVRVRCVPTITQVMLNKGLRFETFCDQWTFEMDIEFDSIIDVITRLWWEVNRLYGECTSKVDSMDARRMKLRLTLGEALDFIYAVTPPLLQSTIPSSIKDTDSIKEVLKTYLMEDHGGAEKFYMSHFKKMTMLDREQDVTTLTPDILKRVNMIRDHNAQISLTSRTNKMPVAYMIHGENHPTRLIGENDKYGLYVFHAWNRREVCKLFNTILKYPSSFSILDYHHDPQNGHYITIQLFHNSNAYDDMGILDAIIQRSYGWM